MFLALVTVFIYQMLFVCSEYIHACNIICNVSTDWI